MNVILMVIFEVNFELELEIVDVVNLEFICQLMVMYGESIEVNDLE